MTAYDIVVLGDVNLDFVVARNLSFPLSSLVQNGLIYWEDIDQRPGGSGLNFCAFAAEAGYRCLMLGKAGEDAAGATLTAWLEARGIAMPRSWRCDLPTGIAVIMRDSRDIRLVINSINNANHALSETDVMDHQTPLMSCRVVYVSGYCISDPSRPRHQAALAAMALAKTSEHAPTVVFDVVPHRIYETIDFAQLRICTQHVDILISEVATMRRFLGLGTKTEIIDKSIASDTAERVSRYFPRTVLRYGPSGCDEEMLTDSMAETAIHRVTGHDCAADKRGYGDRLALNALDEYFHVLRPVQECCAGR